MRSERGRSDDDGRKDYSIHGILGGGNRGKRTQQIDSLGAVRTRGCVSTQQQQQQDEECCAKERRRRISFERSVSDSVRAPLSAAR